MRKTIVINRLLVTKDGWSYNAQKRIEEALSKCVEHNIIFYPDKEEILLGDLFNDFLGNAINYANRSKEALKKIAKENKIDRVIFLEPFQFPYMQMIGAGLNKIPISVYLHSSLQYNKYYEFDLLYENFYKSFPHTLVPTDYTGKSYFGEDKERYFSLGGIVDEYKDVAEHNGKVIWAGSRYNDYVKGYDLFIKVVKQFPKIKFVMCVDKRPEVLGRIPNLEVNVGLSSEEYISKCKECSYILSTAREETFGYGVMDAVSLGLMPIVPNRSAYVDLIPKEYRYNTINDINGIFKDLMLFNEEKLAGIVNKYTREKFLQRFKELIK